MSGEPESSSSGAKRSEKRAIHRHHLIYYLRVYDGISSKVIGHVVDISPQGLLLITEEAIGVQEEYRLRMRLPGTESGPDELIFDSVCRWCRKDDNPAFYLAGFQIQNLEAEDLKVIQEMISEFGM